MSQSPPPKPEDLRRAADWLTAQAKFHQSGRPKPRPKSTYSHHHFAKKRKGETP